jgi:hypothetical protein
MARAALDWTVADLAAAAGVGATAGLFSSDQVMG